MDRALIIEATMIQFIVALLVEGMLLKLVELDDRT